MEREKMDLRVGKNFDLHPPLPPPHPVESSSKTGQNVYTTPPPGREFVQDGKFGKSVKFVESIKILRIRPAIHIILN